MIRIILNEIQHTRLKILLSCEIENIKRDQLKLMWEDDSGEELYMCVGVYQSIIDEIDREEPPMSIIPVDPFDEAPF